MDEDTTTSAPADTGVESTQPVQAETTEAATDAVEVTEQTTEANPAERQEAPESAEAELQDWASKKGLTLDSENATKAAKMAREAERAMHQKAQKASEMEKTMTQMSDSSAEATAEQTGQDPELLKRLQRVEVRDQIRDFYDANPDAKNYENEMSEIAQTAGLYGTPEAILKASYAIAVANNAGQVKSQGKREALESLAHKQQAAVPKGHATNSSATPAKKKFEEMSIKEMEAHLGKFRR